MEILRRIGGLADQKIIPCRKLQEALDAGAGMFGALPFISVGQQQNQAGQQSPLILSRAHKLVDYRLGNVSKIAELRLPEDKRLGIIAAITVLKTEHTSLGQSGVIDLAAGLIGGNILQRHILVFVFDIHQN